MWWFIAYLISMIMCALVDVQFFAKRNIDIAWFGFFLILCPVVNIIYSGYIIYKYEPTDLKQFF
jgi:hypothetical protein